MEAADIRVAVVRVVVLKPLAPRAAAVVVFSVKAAESAAPNHAVGTMETATAEAVGRQRPRPSRDHRRAPVAVVSACRRKCLNSLGPLVRPSPVECLMRQRT